MSIHSLPKKVRHFVMLIPKTNPEEQPVLSIGSRVKIKLVTGLISAALAICSCACEKTEMLLPVMFRDVDLFCYIVLLLPHNYILIITCIFNIYKTVLIALILKPNDHFRCI